MRLKNETTDSLSIVTLDSYSKFEELTPWVYKNPTYDPVTGTLGLDKAKALFELPEKIYGNSDKLSEIILKDYRPKGDTLGVLLVGKKGMGKSLLSEKMAMMMVNKGWSVIHVTKPVSASAVEKAVEILAPCMLYLEEFEKCFENTQDVPIFLNMFSSTTIKGLLVVIAANSINSVIYDPLIDRPQRLRYRINYSEIDDNVVEDILADSEVSPEQKKVYTEWVKSSKPNIDSLITLVKLTAHISDPNELIEYISILNVPRLNPLRYKLGSLSIVGWNHPVVGEYPYRVKMESGVNPPSCIISIEGGSLKFKTEIDLTIETDSEPGFRVEKTLEVVLNGDPKRTAKIELDLNFEICRDAGKISKMFSVNVEKEYDDKPMHLLRDGEHIEGSCRNISQWLEWE